MLPCLLPLAWTPHDTYAAVVEGMTWSPRIRQWVAGKGCGRLWLTRGSRVPSRGVVSSAAINGSRVSFVTDVEGDLSFFERVVEGSRVLRARAEKNSRGETKHLRLDFQRQHDGLCPHFVYGGDLFDHGPGDLRLAKSLLEFKERYPEYVHLLAGNRDLNKLRLVCELSEDILALPADSPLHFEPYWVPERYRVLLPDFQRQVMSASKSAYAAVDFVPRSWRATKTPSPDVARLQWILKCTMGAPNCFELRRKELAILRDGKYDPSDEDVLRSYQDSMGAGGVVLKYMAQTQLAVILGDTLFVHGSVSEANIGKLPPKCFSQGVAPEAKSISCAHRWVECLNAWALENLNECVEAASSARRKANLFPAARPRGCWSPPGWDLADYGVPGGGGGTSVVYSTWLNKDFLPVGHDDIRVANYLAASGIHRVITGHQPVGDCPVPLVNHLGQIVIMADTSYCDPSPADRHSRGRSRAEVEVECDSTRINAVDNEGRDVTFVVEEWISVVGRRLQDSSGAWWVGRPVSAEEQARKSGDPLLLLWRPTKKAAHPSSKEYKTMPLSKVKQALCLSATASRTA